MAGAGCGVFGVLHLADSESLNTDAGNSTCGLIIQTGEDASIDATSSLTSATSIRKLRQAYFCGILDALRPEAYCARYFIYAKIMGNFLRHV